MERSECIAMLYPELEDKLVVTIMGACAQELYDVGHRENFFTCSMRWDSRLLLGSGWRCSGRTNVLWCWTGMARC